jgi:cytochrome c oxidase subunit 2
VFWAGLGVFVIVEGMLLYTIVRYRRRRGDDLPPQTHGHLGLEIGWTIAPTILVVIVAALTGPVIFANAQEPEEDALTIRAIGHQWWFEFTYPELGVVTANELHLPVGRPAAIVIESVDVIHSFWVPALRGKVDMVPGRTSVIRLLPEATGTFPGQCAEFCGTAHALMRFTVVVEEPDVFDDWVTHQLGDRIPPSTELGQAGEAMLAPAGCIACHTIRGVSEVGTVGPDLTHLGSRGHIASNTLEMSRENLGKWLRDPADVKPGNFMNLPRPLTEDEIEALVEYLAGLQ